MTLVTILILYSDMFFRKTCVHPFVARMRHIAHISALCNVEAQLLPVDVDAVRCPNSRPLQSTSGFPTHAAAHGGRRKAVSLSDLGGFFMLFFYV